MIDATTATRPWGASSRVIPTDCRYPAPEHSLSESRLKSNATSAADRLIPLGSVCPEDSGTSQNHSKASFLGNGLIPEDALASIQSSDEARDRAKKLQQAMGLTGTIVPTGSALGNGAAMGTSNKSLWDENFSSAFLSSNRLQGHSKQASLGYAMLIQGAILILVISLPLMFTERIQAGKFLATMMAPPPQFTTGAPAPPTAQPKATGPVRPPTKRVFMQSGKLTFPTAIPKHAAVIDEAPLEGAPNIGVGFGGVYGGLPVGADLLGSMAQPAAPPPMLPSAEPVAEGPKQPLRVGGDVKPPKLIHQIDPVYPRLAKTAKVQGDVVISIVINARGEVEDAKVTAGPPLLFTAALAAVREWRFEPTYLNGQPWPVAHEVTIHFRI